MAAGAGVIAAANPMMALADTLATQKKLKDFGFISGIIKKELEGDWKAVLRKTVEYGFTEIEMGNYLGDSMDGFLKYCNEIGLKPAGGGCGAITDDMDALKAKLDTLNQLGGDFAVVYWPWQVGAPFQLEHAKKSVELLNKMGEVAKAHGQQLCWHNHDKEFHAMDAEGLPFDYLMNNTYAELVKCQMDVYWVKKGGGEPLEMLKKYDGRYVALHIKDMAPGDEMDFECAGSGVIDFAPVIKEASKQGVKHYFVEKDGAVNGLGCLKSSGDYLKNLRF